MIQRIQSFYLILAVCACALCFMFPVATFHAVDGQQCTQVSSQLMLIPSDDADINTLSQIEQGAPLVQLSQKSYIHIWPLALFAGLFGVVGLVSIFLYKNRTTQVRVVAFGFLLNVVYVFLVFIWAVDGFAEKFLSVAQTLGCNEVSTNYSIATWASLVSLLFFFLAQRAIKKDEAKVRAADRLR